MSLHGVLRAAEVVNAAAKSPQSGECDARDAKHVLLSLPVNPFTYPVVLARAAEACVRSSDVGVRQAVRRCFGSIRAQVAAGLELRHDHGSHYISADFQNEIAFFGLRSSPAFGRAPEGNGCVERAIRTLKEQLLWVKSIETVEQLRQALPQWAQLYNEQWLIERHGFKPPAQRRREYSAESEKLAT